MHVGFERGVRDDAASKWPEQVEGMEFLFSDVGKPVGRAGLSGGRVGSQCWKS